MMELSRRDLLGAFAAALSPLGHLAAQPMQSGESAVELIPAAGDGARYWPRWRGPSGQGLAAGPYPDGWSATENVLWRTAVPGSGNSSPIVWGDRLYLTAAYSGGRRVSVLAFRRSDGAALWEAFAPGGGASMAHPKNGHASATPTADGERIYAYFGQRGLMAVDPEGKVVWHREFGSINASHGTAGSPLLYRDRVIVYQDHYNGSFIAAFDARTGRDVWRTGRDANVGWGTPVAIRVGDHDEIIVNGQRRVRAYDPASGAELWHCAGSTYEVIPTPVVGHGLVFCASGRAGPTLAIRPGGRGDVRDTHLVWSSPRGSPFVPSPVLYGGALYMVNDMSGIVTCLEATTGRPAWQGRLGLMYTEGFSASPVAVDGKVFFTNDEGETFVLRAGPTFDLLRVNRLGERVLASPALVDGRWYVRTDRHLVAIGTRALA
jgi:outer membrane protein assembly factor BamB